MAQYHQIYPKSQKLSYKSGEIVDFVLTTPSAGVMLNSVRISGNLVVAGIPNTQRVYYDSAIGIHSFFNNFTTSTMRTGVIENRSYYPRFVKMKRTASVATSEIFTESKYTPELVCSDDSLTAALLVNRGSGNPITGNAIAFSFMPDICLNNATTVDGTMPILPNDLAGDITVSFRLCQAIEALYGSDSAACSFTIEDLRLDFMSIPLPAKHKASQLNMLVINEVKQVLNSSNNQLSVNLPLSIYSMSGSFLAVSKEFSQLACNTMLEQPPQVNRVYFQFNDLTNGYIAYPLESMEDILENYLDSFPEGNSEHKQDFTLAKISNGTAYGVGLGFSDAVSLANSNFGVNIRSDGISSTAPYYFYMFFRSYVSL